MFLNFPDLIVILLKFSILIKQFFAKFYDSNPFKIIFQTKILLKNIFVFGSAEKYIICLNELKLTLSEIVKFAIDIIEFEGFFYYKLHSNKELFINYVYYIFIYFA